MKFEFSPLRIRGYFQRYALYKSTFYLLTLLTYLTSVILTTLIIRHHIILPFQTQNFPISQILPSKDTWHLFGLISWITGLLYGFFLFQFSF